jgi:hypothetical protein
MTKLWLTLAILLAPGQEAPRGAAAPMTAYHDASTGVTYRYPAEFKPQAQLAAALERSKAGTSGDPDKDAEAKCMSFPLALGKGDGSPDTTDFGVIVMLRVDHTCMGEAVSVQTLGEAAQQMARIIKAFGTPLTEDAVHYKLDGHEAAYVKGSAEAKILGDGKMIHSASVCALAGKSTLCWLILATNHKEMPGLVATPVMFEGHVEVPLVPKDMVEGW